MGRKTERKNLLFDEKKTEEKMIKIWLGDLGIYNEGRLVGEWIHLPTDIDALDHKIKQYSRNGKGDFFIADSECEIEIPRIESFSPYILNELAEELESLSDYDIDRIEYLISDGCTIKEALESYEDLTFYQGMTLIEVAHDMLDEGLFGEIPDSLIYYIDTEAIARDLGHDGYYETKKGVFRRD